MRWFGEGDRNTKFFTLCYREKRKLNISEIQTMQGDVINTGKNIGDAVVSFYEE